MQGLGHGFLFTLSLWSASLGKENLMAAEPVGAAHSEAVLEDLVVAYWANPMDEIEQSIRGFAEQNQLNTASQKALVDKVHLHGRIRRAFDDCDLKTDNTKQLKHRLLLGVQSAIDGASLCSKTPIPGLDQLREAISKVSANDERAVLDQARLELFDSLVRIQRQLGVKDQIKNLQSFCQRQRCPTGTRQRLQETIQNQDASQNQGTSQKQGGWNRASIATDPDSVWEAYQKFKQGRRLQPQEGLLLSAPVWAKVLTSSQEISRASLEAKVSQARQEVLERTQADFNEEWEKIRREDGSSRPPALVSEHLRSLVQKHPLVVGSLLAKKPEYAAVICRQLQNLEGGPSAEEVEKQWLWMSGGALLVTGAGLVGSIVGVPLTLGRVMFGASTALAVKGNLEEQERAQLLLEEAQNLRWDFFAGVEDRPLLESSLQKEKEAYVSLIQSYAEAAQILPVGRLGTVTRTAYGIHRTSGSSPGISEVPSFFNQLKVAALKDSQFSNNYRRLQTEFGNPGEWDKLEGAIASLGHKAHASWVRFISRPPADAKTRLERVVQSSRKKVCPR